MTQTNKLKRAARERAKKTGESYAAARRQVVAKLDRKRDDATKAAAAKARKAPASGVVTEAKCIENTGHGFDHWFAILDRFGAVKAGHTASARYLREEHDVSAWYCQAITVSYERARGVRAVNQLCSGTFQVSVTRVLPVSLDRAVTAITKASERRKWLDHDDAVLAALKSARVSRKAEAAHWRLDLADARVDLRVTTKPDGRSTVGADVTKLADQAAVERERTAWRHTLDRLREHLSTS